MKRKNVRTIALVMLLLGILGVTGVAAQTGSTFFVTDVNTDTFPQVNFRLRVVDLANRVVGGLNPSNLTVYENSEQVSGLEVTPNADGPITYIFMLDQGRTAYYTTFQLNNIRQVISTLVSGGYFVDGRDTVMVLGRTYENSDRTMVHLPATKTATDLTTWVANFGFDRGRGNTKGLLGVEDAIREMNELVPVQGSQTTAIIFITRYIEDPSNTVAPSSAQNTAAEARQNNMSIYVFHVDPNQYRRETLEVLAEGSNGQYAHVTRNNYLSVVSGVYQAINTQRTYYTVSYRSTSSEPGTREITVNNPGRPSEGVIGTYEVALQPPTLDITEPIMNSTIRREARILVDGEQLVPSFDLTRVRVSAEASWADGYPRVIRTAELYINGVLEDSLEVAEDQTQFDFEWDVTDITVEGTNSVILEVQVEDELGMTAKTESLMNVEVVILATPTPEGIEITPTVAAVSVPALCGIGILLAGVIGGIYFYFRKRSGAPVRKAPAVDHSDVGATLLSVDSTDLALGTITVLTGPSGLIDEIFKITNLKTTFGRDPAQTDISFYADEESSVSRVHCTITLEDDNQFRLIDNNSSAGTKLNGRRIQPDSPIVLDDGDEIVLGDLAQRGVKLQFNFITEESIGPSGASDDRTHFFGGDLMEWEGPPEE